MSIALTKGNFEQETTKHGEILFVDFWAPWCKPCFMMGFVLDEIERELQGRIKILKVNVDDQPELADQFGIKSIPTIAVMKDGKIKTKMIGFQGKDQIFMLLKKLEPAINFSS